MDINILIALICIEAAAIITLVVLLLKVRKRKQIQYYSMQSGLDEYTKQTQAIDKYNNELAKAINLKKIELQRNNELILSRENLKLREEYSFKIPIAENNIKTLKSNISKIDKTNDIDVLQAWHKSNNEIIRWFMNEEAMYPNVPYLLENGAENFSITYKKRYNDNIVRIAGHHFARYRASFIGLQTVKARLTHTNRMLILLDTFRVIIAVDVDNTDFSLDTINEYYKQTNEMLSTLQ